MIPSSKSLSAILKHPLKAHYRRKEADKTMKLSDATTKQRGLLMPPPPKPSIDNTAMVPFSLDAVSNCRSQAMLMLRAWGPRSWPTRIESNWLHNVFDSKLSNGYLIRTRSENEIVGSRAEHGYQRPFHPSLSACTYPISIFESKVNRAWIKEIQCDDSFTSYKCRNQNHDVGAIEQTISCLI